MFYIVSTVLLLIGLLVGFGLTMRVNKHLKDK
jgi:hypothetical protein